MNDSRRMAGLLACCSIAGLVVYAWHNLSYPGFWWDEAAQFWIAQGLSNYAEPHAAPGGLGAVYRFNMTENLDPGGFTLIEHFWTRVNRQVPWIRALPLTFLVATLFAAAALGRVLSRSWLIAGAGLGLPLLYSGILYFGMENRAYSMEMAGIAGALVLLQLALRRDSWQGFLALGVFCAAFLSSRYSYVYCVLSVFLVLVFFAPAGRGAGLNRYIGKTALCAVPIALCGTWIGLFMLADQLWPEMKGAGGLEIAAPAYTRHSVLKDNPDLPALLARNFLSPAALPITTAIVYFLFVQKWLYRILRERQDMGGLAMCNEVNVALVFVLCYQVTGIVFSWLGFYPWDIRSRWNAGLLIVSVIAVLTLVSEAVHLVRASRIAADRRWSKPVLVAVVILSIAVLVRTTDYRLARKTPWGNLPDQLERLFDDDRWPAPTWVTFYEVPVVRYLFEYGPLRQRKEYPGAFRFETAGEWRANSAIDAAGEKIRFIITAQGRRALGERLAGHSLRPLGPGRAAPFLVVGDGG